MCNIFVYILSVVFHIFWIPVCMSFKAYLLCCVCACACGHFNAPFLSKMKFDDSQPLTEHISQNIWDRCIPKTTNG